MYTHSESTQQLCCCCCACVYSVLYMVQCDFESWLGRPVPAYQAWPVLYLYLSHGCRVSERNSSNISRTQNDTLGAKLPKWWAQHRWGSNLLNTNPHRVGRIETFLFLSFNRRSRYSIWPLERLDEHVVPHSNCALGVRVRSSFGPNSTNLAQIWPCACVPDPGRVCFSPELWANLGEI